MTSPGACYEPAEAEQVPRRPFSNMVIFWDLIGYGYGSIPIDTF